MTHAENINTLKLTKKYVEGSFKAKLENCYRFKFMFLKEFKKMGCMKLGIKPEYNRDNKQKLSTLQIRSCLSVLLVYCRGSPYTRSIRRTSSLTLVCYIYVFPHTRTLFCSSLFSAVISLSSDRFCERLLQCSLFTVNRLHHSHT